MIFSPSKQIELNNNFLYNGIGAYVCVFGAILKTIFLSFVFLQNRDIPCLVIFLLLFNNEISRELTGNVHFGLHSSFADDCQF